MYSRSALGSIFIVAEYLMGFCVSEDTLILPRAVGCEQVQGVAILVGLY